MTVKTVTDERLGQFALKQHDWFERVRKGSLSSDIVERAIQEIIDNAPKGKYANEEVESSYGYFSGYTCAKSIDEQLEILYKLPMDITVNSSVGASEEPKTVGSEGYFAVPNWVKFFENYPLGVQSSLDMIKEARKGKFYNYREGKIDSDHLRQLAHSAQVWQEISKQQNDADILIIQAQLGFEHRGRSVRRAREVFIENEFGLGAFASGFTILTHPERLQHYDDLYIDCAGDEFAPDAAGGFSRAPLFRFLGGGVRVDARGVDAATASYGSASGFVPQSES